MLDKNQNEGKSVRIYFENYIPLKYIKDNFTNEFQIDYWLFDFLHLSVSLNPLDLISIQNDKIIFQNKVSNIRIVDFLGSYLELEYRSEIDISSYQRGVYILQFAFDNQIYNKKFIKD